MYTFFTIFFTILAILIGVKWGKAKLSIVVMLLLIFMFFAFEDGPVDHKAYIEMYNQIGTNGSIGYEPLYEWLCRLGNRMSLKFDEFRIIVIVFELCLLIITIRKFTTSVAFVLTLYFIFSASVDAELFRQLLANTIVMFSLIFLFDKNKVANFLIYIGLVAVAALIHSSCWFFLAFLLVKIKKKRILAIIVLSITIAFLFLSMTNLFFVILSKLPIRLEIISKYQIGDYTNIKGNIYNFCKILLINLFGIIFYLYIKKRKKIFSFRAEQDGLMENIISFNLISFLCLIPLFYSSSAQRILHVVIFANYLLVANAYAKKKKSFGIKFLSVGFATSFLLMLLFIESTGAVEALVSHFVQNS